MGKAELSRRIGNLRIFASRSRAHIECGRPWRGGPGIEESMIDLRWRRDASTDTNSQRQSKVDIERDRG
jgi:hypothetical protein